MPRFSNSTAERKYQLLLPSAQVDVEGKPWPLDAQGQPILKT
jgi:hypothetical protein